MYKYKYLELKLSFYACIIQKQILQFSFIGIKPQISVFCTVGVRPPHHLIDAAHCAQLKREEVLYFRRKEARPKRVQDVNL